MHFDSKYFHHACIFLATLIISICVPEANAQYGQSTQRDTLTNSVLIHPVIETEENEAVYTSEHTYNPNLRNGDQLARDFLVAKMTEEGFTRKFKADGSVNTDWYGWNKNVLAPISGTISRVEDPSATNTPGTMNRDAQPGLIFFEHDDITIIYVHARKIEVEEGDYIEAGQVVGKVGNNGNSRNPHIHVGAWKGETPLQIQVDLYAENRDHNSETDTTQ